MKELGFDEPCFAVYSNNHFMGTGDEPRLSLYNKKDNDYECRNSVLFLIADDCTAPLFQQAEKWLRKRFKVTLELKTNKPNDICYWYFYVATDRQGYTKLGEGSFEWEVAFNSILEKVLMWDKLK